MRLLLLALLTLVAGCGGCANVPKSTLKSMALRLEFEGSLCSGLMAGPHELRTAKHCVTGGKLLKVNGVPVSAIGWRQTGRDSVVMSVRGITFQRWPRMATAKQGDKVFWWGNPLGVKDIYREGYVAGFVDGSVVIDASICRGDSGSGVFNQRGELVAIVSAMNDLHGCTFMLAVPL